MTALTAERLKRIAEARAETVRHLEKQESYSHDLQKPAKIEFYRAHIAYLDALAAGQPATHAVADRVNWDSTRAVIDARAAH
jgi:hypothetical protein